MFVGSWLRFWIYLMEIYCGRISDEDMSEKSLVLLNKIKMLDLCLHFEQPVGEKKENKK